MSEKTSDDSASDFDPPVEFEGQNWEEEDWLVLLKDLRDRGFFRWREVGRLVLEALNPSQIGTSLASSDGFQSNYGKGNTMSVVMQWLYEQDGRCEESGTRLNLQADHIEPKEDFDNPEEADVVENMQLLSRRENVIRRKSHTFGGRTHLPAAAALMWLLLNYNPRTLEDFTILCRLYGMTMADVRMQEGWAMAHWLAKDPNYDYEIEGEEMHMVSKKSDILRWPDNGLTRRWPEDEVEGDFEVIASDVSPSDHIYFVVARQKGEQVRLETYHKPVKAYRFSHYFDDPEALAVKYSDPDRDADPPKPPTFPPQPPREMRLLALRVGEESGWSVETTHVTPDGHEKKITKSGMPPRTNSGQIKGLNGLKIEDINPASTNLDARIVFDGEGTENGQQAMPFG